MGIRFEINGKVVRLDKTDFMSDTYLMIKVSPKSVKSAQQAYDEFNPKTNKEISCTLQEASKKKTPRANKYYWKLVRELSMASGIPDMDIYKQHVRNDVVDNFEWDAVAEDALDAHEKMWGLQGDGWFVVDFDEIPGKRNVILFDDEGNPHEVEKTFRRVRKYKGSSTYNREQMGMLIDALIRDCEQYGVETKTPDEIARMMDLYERERQ